MGIDLRGWRCRATGPRRATLVYLHGIADNRASGAGVIAVVAAEPFSDLRTVATERAPLFFTSGHIARAFVMAGEPGKFATDAVSAVRAAEKIRAPVLLIHGADDTDTRPDHARRIFERLAGPKRLILVPGAGHNQSLTRDVWKEVERWLDEIVRS